VTNRTALTIAQTLKASIEEALAQTFSPDSVEYARYVPAAHFDQAMMFDVPDHVHAEAFALQREHALALLDQAVRALEERLSEVGIPVAKVNFVDDIPKTLNRRVFVVHGRNKGALEAVARYLERADFEPVILHEQANQGRTIIEKFEDHADVGFAVVLLTPDDVGEAAVGGESKPRARQNVILELGYFIGQLGRKHVCALKMGDLELPSDILGVVWTELDDAGGWKASLAKELKAAGYEIDWNKVMA